MIQGWSKKIWNTRKNCSRLRREVQNDAISYWQVFDTLPELGKGESRKLGAIEQLTLQHVACFNRGDLAGQLPGKTLRTRTVHMRVYLLKTHWFAEYTAAMDDHHDMICLRRRNNAFLGIGGEPGVSDDVVVGSIGPGVE